jgi:formylglycine-generating enzyme required for sulfatase activity
MVDFMDSGMGAPRTSHRKIIIAFGNTFPEAIRHAEIFVKNGWRLHKDEGNYFKVIDLSGKTISAGRSDEEVMRLALATIDSEVPEQSVPEIKIPEPALGNVTPGKAGVQWVTIPGGTFIMGSKDMDLRASMPRRRVTVKSFQMAKTLVTNKQYKACVKAGVCTAPVSCGKQFQGDDNPVVCVDWKQAKTFSEWIGGRLPSEAQWEYAARSGGQDWKFPWGDDPATCDLAIMGRTVVGDPLRMGCGKHSSWPVCSKPAGNSKQGLCDMAGNASEWVQDWYHDSYAGAPADDNSWDDGGTLRVFRGGGWSDDSWDLRSAGRSEYPPESCANNLGFRPVRDIRNASNDLKAAGSQAPN